MILGDIINLKQFKKRKTRAEKQQQADANRILFGRTKTEKTFAKNQQEKSERFLEQNRLETASPDTADLHGDDKTS